MNKAIKGFLFGISLAVATAGILAIINKRNEQILIENESTATEKKSSKYSSVRELNPGVFELNYSKFDEDKALKYIESKYDQWISPGGCTAMAKQVSDGDIIIARNMDLYITNKPSYLIRTKLPGKINTIGLSYSAYSGDDISFVKKHGILKDNYNIMPLLQTDVMNSSGLYIEVNMRNATYSLNDSGELESVFSCSGTNPGKKRIISFALPEFLGTRCNNIDEALNLVQNELDIYTPNPNGAMDWNFGLMLADSTGRYGVLEIARDQYGIERAVFTEGKASDEEQSEEAKLGSIQANYYLHEDLAAVEKMGAGFGRVSYLSELYPEIKTEEEMFDAIKDVSYFQSYDRENCLFDSKSEFVGYHYPDNYFTELEVWDNDFINDPENEEAINNYIDWCKERINYYEELGTLKDVGLFWNSTFTLTANVNEKTFNIRFYEQENNTLKIKVR